jgi:hypothetical protein
MINTTRLSSLTWPILKMLNKTTMIIKHKKTNRMRVIRRWNTSLIRMKLNSFKAVLPLTKSKRPLNCKYPMRRMTNPCNKMKMIL